LTHVLRLALSYSIGQRGVDMRRIIAAYYNSDWPIVITLAILSYMAIC